MSARTGLSPLLKTMLIVGFVFLYAPILSLIVYSFNESKLVTVWSGFSFKWYGELFRDAGIMKAGLIGPALAGLLVAAVACVTVWALAFAGAFFATVLAMVVLSFSLLRSNHLEHKKR